MAFRSTPSKSYGNPLFAQARAMPWVLRHPWLAMLCLLVLLALGVYGMYGAPWWKMQKMELTGTYTFAVEEARALTLRQMESRWLFFFRQRNLWAFDTKAYERRLQERWIFSSLEVTKQIPGTLHVSVVEEKPTFTYLDGSKIYGIGRAGKISTVLQNPPSGAVALAYSEPLQNVSLGKQLLEPSQVTFLQSWRDALQARNLPEIILVSCSFRPFPDQTVRLRVQGEWDIVTDLAQNVQPQIDAFFLAYEQKLQGKRLDYVDVTVPARVYYR